MHYRVRAPNRLYLFGPRLLVSVALTWLTAVIGLSIATYQIAVLFEDVDFNRLLSAFLIQTIGIGFVTFLAAALATRTNRPGISAIVVYFVVFIIDFLRDTEWVRGYFPTALLQPTDLLDTAELSSYVGPAFSAGVLVLLVAVLSLWGGVRERHVPLSIASLGGEEVPSATTDLKNGSRPTAKLRVADDSDSNSVKQEKSGLIFGHGPETNRS